MNPIYEYIAAIFVMTLIVGYSLYSLNTMSSSQLNLAYEEQLQPVAARLYDKILLTEGYPENWGSDPYVNNTSIGDFGLSSSYGEMYNLDIDKLMRLVPNVGYTSNALYLRPTTMGNLTGIYDGESWGYGFRLRMVSALNINVTYEIPAHLQTAESFNVSVTNYWGRYAGNAEVSGLYFVVWIEKAKGNEEVFNYSFSMATNITNWQGQAILDFTGKMPYLPNNVQKYGYILFTNANYYGIQSQKIDVVGGPMQTINLWLYKNYLIANYTEIENVARGAYHLELTVIQFTSNQQVVLDPAVNITNGQDDQVINSGGKDYAVFSLNNPALEDILFACLLVKKTGQWTLAFCSRPYMIDTIDYRSHSFAYAGINTETYTRLVRFGHSSYYAELTLWRMSQ